MLYNYHTLCFWLKLLFSIIFTFTYSIGIPPNQPLLLQTPGVGHEAGRAYAGEFPQGSVTKEDMSKKILLLIKKGYIQVADGFVGKVKRKYYQCMLCPEDENKMRKQFGDRPSTINHFETFDAEHKKCI